MSFIEVNNVSKKFRINQRASGIPGMLANLIVPRYEYRQAVKDISFSIEEGEMIGFIGPNGAGKSTTIKMLSGILCPDSGEVQVGGYTPYKDRKNYVGNIGVVFGQKSQLQWDLPVMDSFELLKAIYRIPDKVYRENIDRFTEMLDMSTFLHQPVRQLSLGQRMRADIVAALLHSPKIVFFDEPTIGVDVVGKETIRRFIRELNEKDNITMIFTTHDMQDIEKVCDRLIFIDAGKKVYDGSIDEIKTKYAHSKTVEMLLEDGTKEVKTFDVNETPMNEVMEQLFSEYHIKDISICEPEIDGIIRDIYEGRVSLDTKKAGVSHS